MMVMPGKLAAHMEDLSKFEIETQAGDQQQQYRQGNHSQ
jgi:hypothetical protein